MNQQQTPKVGTIVGCWFPFNEYEIDNGGQKFRPSIILAMMKKFGDDRVFYKICPGSGQSSAALKLSMNKSKFEIEPGRLNTLQDKTKFDLSATITLPFLPKYFQHQPNTITSYTRYGELCDVEKILILNKIQNTEFDLSFANLKPLVIQK